MTNKDFSFKQEGCDGALIWENSKTIKRYQQLCNERSAIDTAKFDIFWAFSNQQFADGLKSIRPLKDGEKLVRIGAGGFGTRDGVDRYLKCLHEYDDRIKEDCDPQEVYCWEYNNHESFLSWDGDMGAIQVIIDIWGADVAKTIKRRSVCYSIDEMSQKQ